VEVKSQETGEAFIFAANLDQFVEDQFIVVDHPSGSVGVVRHEGAFYAVTNKCPHMGAPLCIGGGVKATTRTVDFPFEYETDNSVPLVRCPWHRWEYSLIDGRNAGHINSTKIRTYPVRVDGDKVFVGRSANKLKEMA